MGLLSTNNGPMLGSESQQTKINDEVVDNTKPVKQTGKVVVRYVWESAPMGECNVGIQIPVGNILSKEFESVTVKLIDKIYQEDDSNSKELNAKIVESLSANGFCKYTEIIDSELDEDDDDKKPKSNKSSKRKLKKDKSEEEDEQNTLVNISKLVWCHPDHSEDDPINCKYELEYVKDETDLIETLDIVDGHFTTSDKDPDLIEALKNSGFIIMGEKTE